MPRARVLEHDEVADQGQKPGLLEHALDDGSELRHTLGCDGGPVHGAPGHEPFEIGRQRAEACMEPVRGRERGVRAEQGRYFVLVGLELVEGPFEGGVLVAGVLSVRSRPEGRPLTNSTISGRRLWPCSITVNWFTASQSLASTSYRSRSVGRYLRRCSHPHGRSRPTLLRSGSGAGGGSLP